MSGSTRHQGKTELCRQLVVTLPGLMVQPGEAKFPGIDACTCIHITFNQSSTWDDTVDGKRGIVMATWVRVCKSFGAEALVHDKASTARSKELNPQRLEEIVDFLRDVAAHAFELQPMSTRCLPAVR